MGVKVDSIKYDTDIADFMDVGKITDLTEDCIDGKYVADMNEAFNMLNAQMSNGGLSPYAFVFDGTAPLYTKAGEICVEIERLSLQATKLKKSIIQNANIQRKNQFVQLKKKIIEQIDIWEADKTYYSGQATALEARWERYDEDPIRNPCPNEARNTYSDKVTELQELIDTYNDKIENVIQPEITSLANTEGVG